MNALLILTKGPVKENAIVSYEHSEKIEIFNFVEL